MQESKYEKIRNHLSTISIMMDVLRHDGMETGSLLKKSYDSLEKIKNILDEMEREEQWEK